MRVHIGGDHAAYELHQVLVAHLTDAGHDVTDHGPYVLDPEDDYPVAVLRAAQAVAGDPGSLGVVLGGSGNGEQIAANKVTGIRAALASTPELAQLARQHNDAQVVSIGGRFTAVEEAKEIVDVFLATPFSGVARHARRLEMVSRYEADGSLPAQPEQGPGKQS
ncbi:MAG: ribose-5-phosphate isomerase [Lapillicoccus sp.]